MFAGRCTLATAGKKVSYISDQPDHALGLNAHGKNLAAAKTFLEWVASPAFASVYQDSLPGFSTGVPAGREL